MMMLDHDDDNDMLMLLLFMTIGGSEYSFVVVAIVLPRFRTGRVAT